MARIFSISYAFDNQIHNTLVTVRTTPFYMEYILSNLAPDLLAQLPGNTIISPSAKNFLFPNATAAHSKELMNALISAVMVHLQVVKT